jgi:hypothetical protein
VRGRFCSFGKRKYGCLFGEGGFVFFEKPKSLFCFCGSTIDHRFLQNLLDSRGKRTFASADNVETLDTALDQYTIMVTK